MLSFNQLDFGSEGVENSLQLQILVYAFVYSSSQANADCNKADMTGCKRKRYRKAFLKSTSATLRDETTCSILNKLLYKSFDKKTMDSVRSIKGFEQFSAYILSK